MNDIKTILIMKFDELLSIKLNIFMETNKISGCDIGKEIGRIINNEIKDIRNSFKKPVNKEKKKIEEKELIIINSREELTVIYNDFMKKNLDELKKNNEKAKNKRTILELFQESYNEWKKKEKEIKIIEK